MLRANADVVARQRESGRSSDSDGASAIAWACNRQDTGRGAPTPTNHHGVIIAIGANKCLDAPGSVTANDAERVIRSRGGVNQRRENLTHPASYFAGAASVAASAMPAPETAPRLPVPRQTRVQRWLVPPLQDQIWSLTPLAVRVVG